MKRTVMSTAVRLRLEREFPLDKFYETMVKKTGMKRRHGFTLAEVLVVVVILAIAATIVIPMMGDTNDMKVASAARQVVSTLLYAQTLAISTQQRHQVVFDSVSNEYEIQDESGNVIMDPVSPGQPFRISYTNHPQLRPVVIDSVDIGGTNIVWFDRLGAPYEGDISGNQFLLSQGTITLVAGTNSMNVQVEPVSGRINIAD
jgi:prepilin-type N-terminal cleavage/methylation domain-containing protein